MGDRKIIQFSREGMNPQHLGRYVSDTARALPIARRAAELYQTIDPTNLTPERLAEVGRTVAQTVYRSAINKVLGKVPKSKVGSEYRDNVRKYVQRVLAGDNLGAEVNEVTANWLRDLEYEDINIGKRGKSPLGFNENVNGRSVVYIPRVGENVGIVVSQGIQDYIKIHELMETTEARPKSGREHEKMDATILDVLKEFSATNARARQAYRGAISVYEARGENDPYFRGVSKFYPVREEMLAFSLEKKNLPYPKETTLQEPIRSNVFSVNTKTEGVRLNLAA